MKIHVQADRCQGHARCLAEAPEVFQLDELGYNTTDIGDVPPELQAKARRGVLSCPELALTVIED
ncbi:MAG TPA: ferredoxin [Solirubrobacteraceae bacterium]|nr:ferredoxin [Solirubrobacteraceae bacterium]